MSATNNGSPGSERGILIGYDPIRGYIYERTFEGTYEYCLGLSNLVAPDQAWTIDGSNAPLYRLSVRTFDIDTAATASTSPYTYELLGNGIQKSIYEHPEALRLTSAKILAIKEAVRNGTELTEDQFAEKGIVDDKDGNARSLYNIIVKGADHYMVSQYVLRVSQVVSRRTSLRVGFANVERIYSADSMINEVGTPGVITASIANITTNPAFTALPTGYYWGWLKQTPTVQQIAGGRYSFTVEYWLEAWPTLLYGAVV